MKILLNLSLILLTSLSGFASAHYSGPFLLWGVENLNNLKIPTLQAIDDNVLRDIYSRSTAIVIFIRNATTKLNYENFPELSEIIGKNEWLYLPQESLSSDPFEYNVNAEVFTLTGPVQQQDNEIAAFYRDAQINFGNKNVLGILATRNENGEHLVFKRQAEVTTESSEGSTTPASTPAEEPVVENLVYPDALGKGLLYTTVAPVLTINNTKTNEFARHELIRHTSVRSDGPRGNENNETFSLSVQFIIQDNQAIFLRFFFYISGGRWTMNQVKYDDLSSLNKANWLEISGTPPSAPVNQSYACSGTFVYKNEQITLTLKNIQVQPLITGELRFGRAQDCVGFMTPAILSGIFVTFILGIVLSIGISAILDIKPPNKFESRSSKQLTFTVQE